MGELSSFASRSNQREHIVAVIQTFAEMHLLQTLLVMLSLSDLSRSFIQRAESSLYSFSRGIHVDCVCRSEASPEMAAAMHVLSTAEFDFHVQLLHKCFGMGSRPPRGGSVY